jgi:signal transduction histidine kinase
MKRNKRRIGILLAAATLIPIGVFGGLGAQILRQERVVERQQAAEALTLAADRFALGIEGVLAGIEGPLSRGEGVRFTRNGIIGSPEFGPVYQPTIAPRFADITKIPDVIADTEKLEYRDPDAAISAYLQLADEDRPPPIRAIALRNLGGLFGKRNDRAAALRAYENLERLGSLSVSGQPAAIVALLGRAQIYEQAGMTEDLQREAGNFSRELYSGHWPVDRDWFDYYRTDLLPRWNAPPPPADAIPLTETSIRLWESWREGALPPRGRRVLDQDGVRILAIWNGTTTETAVWLSPSSHFGTRIAALADAEHLHFSVYDTDGRLFFTNSDQPQREGVALAPTETRLPFVLKVAAASEIETLSGGSGAKRRAVLIAGLALAFSLMIAAALLLYRITTREMALVRQQSDFVAAVSHEFRTPLTSMRHLIDLLETRSVPSDERKEHYYRLLGQGTDRLHRMVESLLSFARIEEGAYAWRIEEADAAELTQTVVDEFRREPHAAGRELICVADAILTPIRADRTALSCALWNLLENAAKYSRPGTPIRVSTHRRGNAVAFGVADEGVGIPAEEQKRVFEKFVRGADAKRAGIRGIGIGLTLVECIARAHKGSVQLESEPGRGSTFTLVIPCLES